MTNNSHAGEWIASVKKAKEHYKQLLAPYSPSMKAAPHDIEQLTKIIEMLEKDSKAIGEDLHDMNQAAAGIAGAQDKSQLENAHILLRTLKSHMQK